ncbi:MAG: hypothetical protein ACP5D2_02935 [Candidatus Nanoarchaeia archaeon]
MRWLIFLLLVFLASVSACGMDKWERYDYAGNWAMDWKSRYEEENWDERIIWEEKIRYGRGYNEMYLEKVGYRDRKPRREYRRYYSRYLKTYGTGYYCYNNPPGSLFYRKCR